MKCLDEENDRISPGFAEANVGESVNFHCHDDFLVSALWEFNDGIIRGYAVKSSFNEIKIQSVALNNSGYYTCFGVYGSVYSPKRFIAKGRLKVFGKMIRVIQLLWLIR